MSDNPILTARQRQVLAYAAQGIIRIVPPRYDVYPYVYFQVWEWSPKFECFKWVDITSTVAKLKQKRLLKAWKPERPKYRNEVGSVNVTVAGISALYGV